MRATMKLFVALAVTCVILVPELAPAAPAAPARPNRISVSYVPPKDPAHQPIYQRLKENGFLEKLQKFLSPFRLPRTLRVKTAGCDGEANAWYEDDAITICYEYIDEIWKAVPAETTAAGVTPIDALVGPVIDTCLHEFGHAIFEMLKVPVFGREEDAADQLSAYIMLQFGKADARRQIGGVAYTYMTEAKAAAPPALKEFADVHGTPAQRFYNVLCVAYGADPELFGDLVAKGYLPKERAEGCEDEYKQVAFAFQKLIGPHIDRRLAKAVLDKSWLPDPTTKVRRKPGAKPSAQPK
jgi:hypothetical protein